VTAARVGHGGQHEDMTTSGGGTLNAVLYVTILSLAVQIGARLIAPHEFRPSWPAVGLWAAVAVPSVLQFAFPHLLTALRRDPELIRHHHQYWRVLTSVLVQDGGVAGTIFNLAVLAVVATVAVQIWGPLPAMVLFVLGQLVFDLAATFLSDDLGAGNSGADFSLIMSVVGLALLVRRETAVTLRTAGIAIAAVLLLVINDAHAIPVFGGVMIGVAAGLVTGFGPDVWQTRYHDAKS
jgi:membrane associated rhomboid family serine protease